jgi:hypothetical protein
VSEPPEASGPPPASPSLERLDARREQRRRAAAKRRRRRRLLLLIGIPLLGFAAWAVISYAAWMLKPTSESFSARSVEWVRADVPFGNKIVDEVEHVYYTANAPKKNGAAPKRLPAVGLSLARRNTGSRWPHRIRPVFAHPLPGEGVWKPTGPPINGGPPVLVATFRPETEYPQLFAYVAWFDHTRTQIGYYPGRYEPPNAAVRGPEMVPESQRYRLLATFNGGFTYEDGENGSIVNGHVNEPLKDGKATVVGYRDGRVAIVNWSGGPSAADVVWARQSLAPIVWDGRLNPELNEDPNSQAWGFTLGGVVRVWRTGVGIDRRGNLIFVAAEGQTVISIAKALQHIGAVRAMEFDINADWHTLIVYSHDHGFFPKMVEPQPNDSPERYLVPDDRDFFAVYRPLPGPVTVPLR